jgi:RNA polymerase sigma-54 factor
MLKQQLDQKLLQKLSPQQIQLIKLLQVPTANIEQRIEKELEENPALEEGKEHLKDGEHEVSEPEEESVEEMDEEDMIDDDFDISDYINDDDVADYKVNNYYRAGKKDQEDEGVPPVVKTTFHEYLMEQLGMLNFNERQEKLAEQLIGSLGEDGYLRRSLRAITDDLAFTRNMDTTPEELEKILKEIQDFDPAGVGARDLQECLLLQISRKKLDTAPPRNAKKILKDHFEAFTKKKYDQLRKKLSLSKEELRAAIDEILKLNPKPGSGYTDQYDSSPNQQHVVPDFIVKNNNGELELTLNERNAPELKVSPQYQEMLKGYKASKKKDKKHKEAMMFIKQKIDSAKWFIDAIKQRQETLWNTMSSILERQGDFFLTGDEADLKPMILKDVAQDTDLDISTISRVVNQKYVQTEFGTFSLKHFFSEGIENQEGEEISTRAVKQALQKIVDEEDKQKPLSDQKLTKKLEEEGYKIARRTVAKYREQLDIPVARLRKEI